jgi:fibronectin type 3 domain-containing protein
VDRTAPDAPTSLSAQVVGPTSVQLTWNSPWLFDPGVTAENVYRDGSLVASVFPLSGYTDSAAPTGVQVNYYVTAVDLAGNESPASNLASLTIGE